MTAQLKYVYANVCNDTPTYAWLLAIHHLAICRLAAQCYCDRYPLDYYKVISDTIQTVSDAGITVLLSLRTIVSNLVPI